MFRNALASLRRSLILQQCPTEQQLAEYADQQSIGADRHRIERHLANCDRCLKQVGFLVRSAAGQAQPVPEELLRRAERLGTPQARSTKFPLGWATIAAGALAAMLAVFVVTNRPDRPDAAPGRSSETAVPSQPGKSAPAQNMKEHSVVRGADTPAAPLILSPQEGQTTGTEGLTFRWATAAGALFYELQVVSDDGDVIWETRSKSTAAELPGGVHLVKGRTYYVRLRIHTDLGSVEDTKAVSFVAR